jgi:hypothetical protein
VDRDHADLTLCRKWLDLCDDHHSGSLGQCFSRKTSREFLRECLRLIDVDKKKIVKGSLDRTRYVALSYVWGEDRMKWEMPRTRKAAVRADKSGEEIIELPKVLPRTIRDAIEVTRVIGYHYLWVDSLCIIQDDEEDRDLQINMMDEIYSNADLTIAAGSGTSCSEYSVFQYIFGFLFYKHCYMIITPPYGNTRRFFMIFLCSFR